MSITEALFKARLNNLAKNPKRVYEETTGIDEKQDELLALDDVKEEDEDNQLPPNVEQDELEDFSDVFEENEDNKDDENKEDVNEEDEIPADIKDDIPEGDEVTLTLDEVEALTEELALSDAELYKGKYRDGLKIKINNKEYFYAPLLNQQAKTLIEKVNKIKTFSVGKALQFLKNNSVEWKPQADKAIHEEVNYPDNWKQIENNWYKIAQRGSFGKHLSECFYAADLKNLANLAKGFPDEAKAFCLWKSAGKTDDVKKL